MSSKAREALEAVVKVGYPHNFQREAPHIREYCYEITTAIDKCFAALAEPLRNCDVGTEEEQSARFHDYCLTNSRDSDVCLGCPLCNKSGRCEFAWSQMPYEKEVCDGAGN